MLSLVLSVSALVTTDLSNNTELLEESVPSEIVFVVLVVGLKCQMCKAKKECLSYQLIGI